MSVAEPKVEPGVLVKEDDALCVALQSSCGTCTRITAPEGMTFSPEQHSTFYFKPSCPVGLSGVNPEWTLHLSDLTKLGQRAVYIIWEQIGRTAKVQGNIILVDGDIYEVRPMLEGLLCVAD